MSELMHDLSFYLSTGLSFLLSALALWGVISFFPRRDTRGHTAAAWLILAIWTGFLATGLNVFYWRVLVDFALYFDLADYRDLSVFGRKYGDFIWKGLALVSIYLHFYARYLSIDHDERNHWSPLLMGLYPDHGHWLVKYSILLQSLFGLKKRRE